ncbi:MAG: ATP-binding protein [Bacteroidales bacterium]|nr:ATP-binding protein [Bacteroidales bacterium]
MIFKNLYINIIVRIILISATCILFPIAYIKYHDWIINANIIAFIIIQIIFLIRRLNFTNRDLISFLDSIKYDDSSIILSNEYQNQDYYRLSRRLQNVNKQILKLKEQNIQKDQYFKTVSEHATVGLLSFDKKGIIKLCNKAFKDLFSIDSIRNISDLNMYNANFENLLQDIKPSEQNLIKIQINNRIYQLTIHATQFILKEEKLKLVSIQDIKNELDEKELESWQKLVQILRHEIMNSIGPISSTIDTLNEIITNPENEETRKLQELNNEMIDDIASGLKIIKDRNLGIQVFIDKFRSLSRLPKPEFALVNVKTLFSNLELLWEKESKKKNINLESTIKDNIKTVYADKNQLEQVIINLIKNSIEAIGDKSNGSIEISVFNLANQKIAIQVTDNGKGINLDDVDNIFLPFYTTKLNGSGIGLSLAKQIIRLHGGTINLDLSEKNRTSFTIEI